MATQRRSYWFLGILMLALAGSIGAQDNAPKTGDPGWPRVFEKGDQKVIMYAPQVDSWDDYRKLVFRSAIEVTADPAKPAAFGVIETKADTRVDPDTRMVVIENLEPEIRFPSLPDADAAPMTALVKDALPKRQSIEVSLDRLLAYVQTPQVAQREVKVSNEPPQIYFSSKPAILLMFQGTPQFKPAANTGLMFAVNANWNVLMDTAESKYYLLNDDSWLVAPDPLKGPWTAVTTLPDSFTKLPDTDEWKDIRAKVPAKQALVVPAVFVSDKPAEIIVTDGEPKYTPIAGTQLMYVSNTQAPLFLCNTDGKHYFLVSGRWFRAQSPSGPWEYATDTLPADFQKIPADSPVAYVLASVPKTDAAEDAVLLASVPHKASVNRSEARVDVTYEGEPVFGTVKGTNIKCAINTQMDVFEVNGQYYCCSDGVWFVASSPTGPWAVCDKVPNEIYSIPADFPKHNDTYVYVYDSTPEVVYVGYTDGYTGQYVSDDGVLVYGSGYAAGYAAASYWFSDWDDRWNVYYPYWYGRPWWSYGRAVVYSPYWGGYYAGYGAVVGPYGGAAWAYGPWRGAGYAARYNPVTGRYARAGYAYGPAGEVHGWAAYNPRTDTAAYHAGGSGIYGSWGRSTVVRDDDWIRGGHRTTPAGTTGWVQTSRGGEAIGTTRGVNKFAAKTGEGDVYAGRDGNVYRNTGDGWQKWDDGSWNDVNPPPKENVARDRAEGRTPGSGAEQAARRDNQIGARESGPRTDTLRQPGQPAQPRTSNLRTNADLGGRGERSVSSLHSDLNYNHQARQYGNYRANDYSRARSAQHPSQSYRPPTRSNYSRPGYQGGGVNRGGGNINRGGGAPRGRR